jgi:hypothetical protein
MFRSHRAPVILIRSLAALALCAPATSVSNRARAQQQEPVVDSAAQTVKVFDFDERPLGNFEDTPMYWRPMTGDGLPAYSAGRLDEEVGHAAPPSFRFTLRGGNIAYEYEHPELVAEPDSDFLVEGWVCAENLVHARALVAIYLVDAAGQRLPGSERVSQLVRSESDAGTRRDEPWQRVHVRLHVDAANAARLRLQLWVLQTYVFVPPDPDTIDPITPQDVDARVWFDDLAVLRLPRVSLSLSDPGGLVRPGASETLQLDVQDTTAAPLAAELTIHAEGENPAEPRLSRSFVLRPGAHEQFRVPLPALEAGMYQARLRVVAREGTAPSADETPAPQASLLADRATRFAVLPKLSGQPQRAMDLGVDLGPWPLAEPSGAAELVADLGCGAIKIGLPIADVSGDDAAAERVRQARDLAHQLVASGIETTGVILPPATSSADSLPLARVFSADGESEELVGPTFACLAGYVSSLQLGAESAELCQPATWDAAALARLRRQLERFLAIPPLIMPRAILDAAATPALLGPAGQLPASAGPEGLPGLSASAGIGGYSFWVPPDLPTRSLPWHLAFWVASGQGPESGALARGGRWLSLGVTRDAALSADDRLADLTRRLILAKAVNPARLYLPAPLEWTTSGGRPAWQPTEQYLALRTLFHALGGAHAVAALNCSDDAVALLFQRGKEYSLAAWTWRENKDPRPILPLGGGGAHITLFPRPVIVEGVDGALLQLQSSFSVRPAFLQLHDPEPAVLSLTNPYDSELAGTIEIRAPSTWQITPNLIRLRLAPGEALRQPLTLDIPPRQIAAEQQLQAFVRVQRPEPATLEFSIPLQVGLRDVAAQASAWWAGDDLLVRQSLRNRSDQIVSFDAFCQPVGRPQLEAVFLHVPPGDTQDHTYRLPAARALAGGQLWVGIQEIGGRRTLDQLVPIPP